MVAKRSLQLDGNRLDSWGCTSKPRFGWETIQYVPITNGAEGLIDEISFWERALTEKEINEMMDVSLDVEAWLYSFGKTGTTLQN